MAEEYANPLYSIEEMECELSDAMVRSDLKQAGQAFEYARLAHKGQLRKEGLPYIIHPMTLAYSAIRQGITDDEIIAVMFLHDVCEDCGITVEQLPFSQTIKDAVWSVTFQRHDNETKADAKKRYYEKVRKNKIGKLVKIFDRCHNVSAMGEVFSNEKIGRYIEETKQYIIPLIADSMEDYPEYAHVLFGMEYHIKSVMYMAQAVLNKNK